MRTVKTYRGTSAAVWLAVAASMLLSITGYAIEYPDPYYSQDFEAWTPERTSFGTWYYDNWCVSNGVARKKNAFGGWNFDPHGGTMMGGLNAPLPNDSYPGYAIHTPVMTNGAGAVSFYYRTAYATPNTTVEVLSTTNGGITWVTNGILIDATTAWTYYETQVSAYGDTIVKIEKRGDGGTASHFFIIDDILVTLPPAYATIADVQFSPATPLTDTPLVISAQVLPRVYGSNLVVTALYSTNGVDFSGASMTETGNNYWATSPGIPGMSTPGMTVDYYIDVQLDGPTTNNTHSYWPTGAPATTDSYLLRARPLSSSYTNMIVAGPPSTNMNLQADYVWRGVTIDGTFIDPTFYFTNSSSSWGDTNQSSAILPINGIADVYDIIDVDETVTTHLEFTFNETATNSVYSIQPCEYVYFDDWSGADSPFSTYVNGENWQMENARTTTGGEAAGKAYLGTGLSCVLQGASNGNIRTPVLTDGLGTLNFRYRNWAEDGSVAGRLAIEKSLTGTVDSWIPVSEIESILSPDYIYVSVPVADDVNQYIRIVNTSSNLDQYMLLDNISATPPGALVILSSGTNTITPTYSPQPVDVTVDFSTSGGATNIQGRVYWRVRDSLDDYDWAPMSFTNNTFYGQIPPTIPGNVDYYFECLYDGFNAAPVQFPDGGPANPQSFTASGSVPAYRFQDFEAWTPERTTFGTWYYDDWCLSNGVARQKNAFGGWNFDPYAGLMMGGLNAPLPDGSYPGNSIRTPLFTNGASILSFYFRTAYDSPDTTFEVLSSTDNGATWVTNDTATNATTTWTYHETAIHAHGDTYVKIEKRGDGNTASHFLILDDIACYPQSADAIITNIFLSPGYPGTADTVQVSCDIYSKDTTVKAFDYSPSLVYKSKYDGSWTTNNNMSLVSSDNGTNTYVGSIPPQEPDTVYYFIRCDFAGYHYTNGAVTANLSPAYYPDGHHSQALPDSFLEYVPRRFISEFETLTVTSSVGNTTMGLVDDYMWQGIFDFDSVSATQMIVRFLGEGYFTGGGYDSSTNYWGDDSQNLFDTPMSGISTQGGADIYVNLDTNSRSQVMFRFNTLTGDYEVRRCAYQDFNGWDANESFFNNSLNLRGQQIFTNNFNTWATNKTYTGTINRDIEDFESWPQTNKAYVARPVGSLETGSSNGYYVSGFRVVPEHVPPFNAAAEFNPSPDAGAVWAHAATLTEGLEKLDWRMRCRLKDNVIVTHTPSPMYPSYEVTATLISTNVGPGIPSYSLMTHYQDENNHVRLFLQETNNAGNSKIYHGFQAIEGGQPVVSDSNAGSNKDLKDQRYTLTLSVGVRPDEGMNIRSYWTEQNTRFEDWRKSTNLLATGAVAFHSDDAQVAIDTVEMRRCTYERWANWSSASFSSFTTGEHVYADCKPDDGKLVLNANTSASVATRYPLPMATVQFDYGRNSGTGAKSILVEGSVNGSTWPTPVTNLLTRTDTGWKTCTITSDDLTGLNYIRIRNGSTSEVKIRDLYTQALTPFYSTNFSDGTMSDWNDSSGYWSVQGTGTNAVLTRPGYCGPELGFKVESKYDPAENDYPNTWDFAYSGTISNMHYQSYSRDFKFWDKLFTRISHTTGYGSLRVDDITMSSWRATNFLSTNGLPSAITGGWKVVEGWTAVETPGENSYQMWISRADPDAEQSIRSPAMTNGVGSIKFDRRFQNTTNGTFDIQYAYTNAPNSWITSHTIFPVSDANWASNQEFEFNLATGLYVRVLHTTTNSPSAILSINNLRISDYTARDDRTWEAYNALITPDPQQSTTIEFEPAVTSRVVRTAYLNNNPTNDVLSPKQFTNTVPFIQSARVAEGIGMVSFWYRSWQSNGLPAGKIKIYASATETNPPANWGLIDTINTVDNTAYRLYQSDFYIRTNFYIRVTSSTNTPDTRICIDNITVAEPLAADLEIQSIELTPTIPMHTTTVQVAAQLGRFVMNPTNIEAKLYYHFGTDDWANASASWDTNDFILLDQMVDSNAYGIKLASTDSIPVQNIDTVVQYYVECTFDGAFSQYSSPKIGRAFSNPSWYSNVNLNIGKGNTNPYYIVYSCLPGTVWINEFNYKYQFTPENNEFVEIAGRAGSIVSNWSLQVMKTDHIPYGDYKLNVTQIPNDDNGFGFWMLGDAEIGAADQVFTNLGAGGSGAEMALAGGIRLIRSSGVWEDSVSYGSGGGSMTGFVYTSEKSQLFNDGTIRLIGTGDVATAFSWDYNPVMYATYNETNHGQAFEWVIPPEPSYTITINNFWTTSSNTWVVFATTHDEEVYPYAWYTTNMIDTNWNAVANPDYDYVPASGSYTQWFDTPVDAPPIYFRVTSTNEP